MSRKIPIKDSDKLASRDHVDVHLIKENNRTEIALMIFLEVDISTVFIIEDQRLYLIRVVQKKGEGERGRNYIARTLRRVLLRNWIIFLKIQREKYKNIYTRAYTDYT